MSPTANPTRIPTTTPTISPRGRFVCLQEPVLNFQYLGISQEIGDCELQVTQLGQILDSCASIGAIAGDDAADFECTEHNASGVVQLLPTVADCSGSSGSATVSAINSMLNNFDNHLDVAHHTQTDTRPPGQDGQNYTHNARVDVGRFSCDPANLGLVVAAVGSCKENANVLNAAIDASLVPQAIPAAVFLPTAQSPSCNAQTMAMLRTKFSPAGSARLTPLA